jgi:hypothetical protein
MLFLIFSLIFSVTTSNDIVDNLKESIFSSSKTSVRVTRTHINPAGEEIFKEYIYKQDDKIRIDEKFGLSTITTFIYDGKTGYSEGRQLLKTGSLEKVFYGCACGYLLAIDEISSSYLGSRAVTLATGRQGNRLYLDYRTQLPIRYELRNKIVEFKNYEEIDGLGKIPFLIVKSGKKGGVAEIIRITEVNEKVSIPVNFFSVPKHLKIEISN